MKVIVIFSSSVVALASASATGQFQLMRDWDFNTSTEGWQIVNMPNAGHDPNPLRVDAPRDLSFGGSPSLRVPDVFQLTGVATPTSYAGDLRWAYNQNLGMKFSLYVRYADPVDLPSIMINCGTDTLYTMASYYGRTNAWQLNTFAFTEAAGGFKSVTTGQAPTRAQFIELLSHVKGIYITTEYHVYGTNEDDTNIDSIRLATPLHTGDANKDGTVNFSDLLKLAQNYGATFSPNNTVAQTWPLGDFNGDNVVNFTDLLSLAQNYGKTVGSSAPAMSQVAFDADWALAQSLVPEPTALLALAGVAAIGRTRR